MGRILILLGVALIVVAIGTIIFFTQTTSNDTVTEILTSIACEDDEFLLETIEFGSGLEINNRPTAFYCVSGDGSAEERRMVNGPIILVMAGTFVVPLLLGILFLIGGIGRSTAVQHGQMMSNAPVNVARRNDGTFDLSSDSLDLSPETMDMLERMVNSFTGSSISGGNELVDKLQQIEKAYSQGLINRTEYERLRQETLDEFNP